VIDPEEFEKDKRIDPLQLDVACIEQPDLFYKWSQMAIEAKGVADRAKLRLDVTEAQLQLECRRDPAAFGLNKSTEESVKAAVKASDTYYKAAKKHLQAKETAALLDKAVTAMEMRKRMLESLVTLHGQQYFAGPSVPRDLASIWLRQKEQAEENLNKRTLKRVRKRKRD